MILSLLVRGVKKEDKTLAVGIQFMLMRVLGKERAGDHRSRYRLCARPGGHRDEWEPVPDLRLHRSMGSKSDLGTPDVGAQAAKEPIGETASNTRVRGGLEG